ncbi:Sister-chromatid cohesion protein 3 [Camellia lanceoleosa]|uniref:Sister-chromatid cohesion protein 3 n=1 Tax=Camellia lanceoleosa TaxID=1840588 RepID=A0ACC0IMW7_9ERIC|nr:Sister-chromatid cohesion protein 3 [Camellia lanceoleosa]
MPNVLWRLKQLRHLYLPAEIKLSCIGKLRLDGLSKLETLEKFDARKCDVRCLSKLTNLRKFSGEVAPKDLVVMLKSPILNNSNRLLQYSSFNIIGDFRTEEEQSLCTELEEDPMPTLGKLPNLRTLILGFDSYIGKEMVCSSGPSSISGGGGEGGYGGCDGGGFPKLINLSLWGLRNLEEWRVEQGAMPCLFRLLIVACPKLKEIPDGLKFITTLRQLNIIHRSFDFIIFTVASNFCLFFSSSSSIDRCSFASDVHNHDSFVSQLTQGIEKKTAKLQGIEKAVVARHEKLSILPRSGGALGFTYTPPTSEDRYLLFVDELRGHLVTLLGGRAAEEVVYAGRVSTGALDDIRRATDLAYKAVAEYGLNQKIGPVSVATLSAGGVDDSGGGIPWGRDQSERSNDMFCDDIYWRVTCWTTKLMSFSTMLIKSAPSGVPSTTQTQKSGTDVLLDLLSIVTPPAQSSPSTSDILSSSLDNKISVNTLQRLSSPSALSGQASLSAVGSPVMDLLDGFAPNLATHEDNGPAYPSIVAFETNSLKIMFNFSKAPGNPQTTIIQAAFTNKSPNVYTDFIFQATVPKLFPSLKLQMYLLWVSVDETEDEDIHKEYVEETNRQAIMIAAAKLIANDTVPEDYLGPEIVSHFVMRGTSVAEIVKHLIAVLKKKNDDVSNIFLEALKRAYHRHMMVVSESNDGSLAGKSFQECKDLAARLSGTFVGAARNKHRSDILKIVKDGIEYAFVDAPKQLSFLDGAVVHFVSKLPTPDILEILKDVQKRTENVNTEVDPCGWRPCHTFVDSLKEKI